VAAKPLGNRLLQITAADDLSVTLCKDGIFGTVSGRSRVGSAMVAFGEENRLRAPSASGLVPLTTAGSDSGCSSAACGPRRE
jgi:hypothetical protein